MSINDLWNDFATRQGYRKWEVRINITKIRDWWIKHQQKKRESHIWIYECGCKPNVGYKSLPYCPTHGMALIRKGVKEHEDT